MEHVHKDLVKLQLEAGEANVPGAIQLYSRANINICVFQTNDALASSHHSSSRAASSSSAAADCSDRLATMIRDGVDGKLFDAPKPNVTVTVATSHIPYVCVGLATQEVLVGAGDLTSAHFPALDMALLSMRKGETCMFAARRRLGYSFGSSHSGDDLLFKVHVVEVFSELDLLPPRQITKHIIHRPPDCSTDSYGFQSPVFGGTARCIVMEMHRFSEKPFDRREQTVEVGGPDVPDWTTIALMSMQTGEFATVRVAENNAIYKVRLMEFTNPEPPRTIPQLVEKMAQLKDSGNDMISRNHSKAYVRYEAGLFWLSQMQPRLLPKPDLNPQALAQLQELEALLQGNLAQAFINIKKFERAIQHASRAIVLNPNSFKNFFRRAKAKKGLRQFQEAVLDLNRAQNILESLNIPTNSDEWKSIDEVRFEIDCEAI